MGPLQSASGGPSDVSHPAAAAMQRLLVLAAASAATLIDREPPPPSPSRLSLASSPECLQTVSCAGRCGEQFVINAGVSCACDPDCTLFNDCCRWEEEEEDLP